MEDIYTIRVKTKPDTRNLYPSERRYSASTVLGLAWVHIALAGTSFLLACLALINPNENNELRRENDTDFIQNTTEAYGKVDNNYILVLAPSLITFFALVAGLASILASVRWYIDRNITWLFLMSILSTVMSLISLILVFVWLATSTEAETLSKEFVNLKEFIVIKHTDVIERNDSHLIIAARNSETKENTSHKFTKRVLCINILIAAFLEFLWSILSVKISFKGMKNTYKEEPNARRGKTISVITKIKGNNTNKFPRNGKLVPPKPDLIDHYPNKKIKRIFLAQSNNGYYLKNQNDKNKNTETSSEFYKERMMNYLNRCASLEGMSNPEHTPSVQSESVLNPIPEVTSVEIDLQDTPDPPKDMTPVKNENIAPVTPVSWGDTPEHTVYNQNNINFDRIFKFGGRKIQNGGQKTQDQVEISVECSENA